jgi:hypothetical protein
MTQTITLISPASMAQLRRHEPVIVSVTNTDGLSAISVVTKFDESREWEAAFIGDEFSPRYADAGSVVTETVPGITKVFTLRRREGWPADDLAEIAAPFDIYFDEVAVSSGSPGYDFIFYDTEGAQAPVYNDWAELYAAAHSLPGIKRVQVVTDLLLSTGSYELAGFEFIAAGGELYLSSGSLTLTGGKLALSGLTVHGAGEAIAVSGTCELVADRVAFNADTSDCFLLASGASLTARLSDGCLLGGDGSDGSHAFNGADATLTLSCTGGCDLTSPVAIGGTNMAITVYVDRSTALSRQLGDEQPFPDPVTSAVYTTRLGGDITSTISFSVNTNDLALAAIDIVDFLRFAPTTGGLSLTGIAAGLLTLPGAIDCANVTANAFTIPHNSTSANDARFLCPGSVDFVAAAGATWRMRYDAVASRWRIWS